MSDPASVRALADDYVTRLADLDTRVATSLGSHPGDDRVPDLSPDGQRAHDDLDRSVLAALPAAAVRDDDDRRCARLLRERLEAQLAVSDADEHLRTVRNIFAPHQQVRQLFELMPTATTEDWATVARRMVSVPEAFAGYRATLAEGSAQGLHAAPRQLETVAGQLDAWVESRWFHTFVASGPDSLRSVLDTAAAAATTATADLRDHLRNDLLPAAAGTPDAVGADRYRLGARLSTGADLDLAEAYAWGWAEYRRIDTEMRREAETVLHGAGPLAAMQHLTEHGEAIEGVAEVRVWLQGLMDDTIAELDGTHFTIDGPVREVEAMIAPPGSAAAPYYTNPSQDFSRPGRTWLPTLGDTRFPLWGLISTWYHEGVPGHHLQLARWTACAAQLSGYQTSIGRISGNIEGWALYAERLMAELGYLDDPGNRMGWLAGQSLRAARVVIDIGVHCGFEPPDEVGGGEWTYDKAWTYLTRYGFMDEKVLRFELNRYLGWPGQAPSYKIGERLWLQLREEVKERDGDGFDLKVFHRRALDIGGVGLDTLRAAVLGEL